MRDAHAEGLLTLADVSAVGAARLWQPPSAAAIGVQAACCR
jgi:hypothetical protein